MTLLLETHDLTAFYGDFQALFGITSTRRGGRDGRHHRRQRRRQIDFLKAIAGLLPRPRRSGALRRRSRSAALPAYDIVKLGIALVPEGRRLFPLAVRRGEPAGRRLRPAAAGRWNLDRVYGSFPLLRERAAIRRHGAVRRPAADGRDRPRADVEPAAAPVRRAQPRPRPDRHPRHLRGAADIKAAGHQRGPGRAGHHPRAAVADRVYCFQEGRVTLTGRPAGSDPRRDPRRLFRTMTDDSAGSTRSSRESCSAASTRSSPPACR